MNKLFLIRHAQSIANKTEVLTGSMDTPLTKQGILQAEAVAKEFCKEHKISKIISSTLTRAIDTAKAFSKISGVKLEEADSRIAECDMGIYEGMKYKNLDLLTREDGFEQDKTKRWSWRPEGGETHEEVYLRVESFLDDLNKKYQNEAIAIITHGCALRLFDAAFKNIAPHYELFLFRNCEIWELDFKGLGIRHEYLNKYLYAKDYFESEAKRE